MRDYPTGSLFGNPVGYNFVTAGRTEIEQSENDLLSGEKNEFASIIDQLANRTPEGADITLTLDAGAQRLATEQLQSRDRLDPGLERRRRLGGRAQPARPARSR